MTYPEIYEELGKKERIVVHLMDQMLTDEAGLWYPGLWNKVIYGIAKRILGRNPFSLVWALGNMTQGSENEVDLRDLFDELNSRNKLFTGMEFNPNEL